MRGSLPGSWAVVQPGNLEEESLLLEKQCKCPVCGRLVIAVSVRSGKAEYDGMDIDLRPRYKSIDMEKYRIVECKGCGYSAMDSDFSGLLKPEVARIREQLGQGSLKEEPGFLRTYEEAYRQYRAALRVSLIKNRSKSERANIALHTAWLIRGWNASGEEIVTGAEEKKYLKYALQFFLDARKNENFPIRNMNEGTLDYLLAALFYECGENYNEAYKYISQVLLNREITKTLRRQAEDLKDLIKEIRKQG